MKAPVKIVRALIRANATLLTLLGARIYPDGEVPDNAARPYVRLACVRNAKAGPLENVGKVHAAQVDALLVGDTEASVQAILDTWETAIAITGQEQTVSGIVVEMIDVDDVSDAPEGPVDLEDGDAWVAESTIELEYRP